MNGFEPIDNVSFKPSRNFGFARIFRKVEKKNKKEGIKVENGIWESNRNVFQKGMKKKSIAHNNFQLLANFIEKNSTPKKEIYFWGINDNFFNLLNVINHGELDNWVCIDGDDRKEEIANNLGYRFLSPKELSSLNQAESFLIILASAHIKPIFEVIKNSGCAAKVIGFSPLAEPGIFPLN